MATCAIISDGSDAVTTRNFIATPPHRLELKEWALLSRNGSAVADAQPDWMTVVAGTGVISTTVDDDGDPCLQYSLPVTITVGYIEAWSADIQARYRVSVTVGRADCSDFDKTCEYTLRLANVCPGRALESDVVVVCPSDGYLISQNNTGPYLEDDSDVTLTAADVDDDGNARFQKVLVDDQADDFEFISSPFSPSLITPQGTYKVENVSFQYMTGSGQTARVVSYAVFFADMAPTCEVNVVALDEAGNERTSTFNIIKG